MDCGVTALPVDKLDFLGVIFLTVGVCSNVMQAAETKRLLKRREQEKKGVILLYEN
ncbi:hypothetical protein DPMN_126799 [Dreissena polymorpha]|uniref:Uncharacterized protein n=1 Tax=Dreissena polymorpha TaxID=45954 RepID=A0A9D4H0T5_DREPO|nr:hypothetical protein DPMN_126799 [Dreissena polymorpha]